MKRWINLPFGGRLVNVLIASFVFVAALAGGLNTLVTSRVINEYLLNAQTDRLQRDLDLANGFYQQKLNAVNSLSQFVALDPQTVAALPAALKGDQAQIQSIDQVVSRMIAAPILDGTRAVVVLDLHGNILTGHSIPAGAEKSPLLLQTGIGAGCRLLPMPWPRRNRSSARK